MEVLYLYNLDVYVGRLYKTGDDVLSFCIDNDKDQYAKRVVIDNVLDRNKSDLLWLCLVDERIVPTYRQNISECLQRIGLTTYDPWQIFKRCNGWNVNDVLWVSPEPVDPETFWEMHPFAKQLGDQERESYMKRQKVNGYDILQKIARV